MNSALFRLMAACLLLSAITGCTGIGYYAQSLNGHLEIVSAREPVDGLIADPSKPETLRAQLELASDIRQFATERLGLPDNDSYRSYVDTGRDFVTWAVFAAPELSLQAQTWCFPLYGCVPYRGYFSEEKALAFAAKMQADGLDAYVGGITAYSTLGRWNDPLLNTMFRSGETYLAGLVFHELAHQQVYIPGDTALNEAFATAVETAGVVDWLDHKGDAAALRRYRAGQDREAEFLELVNTARDELGKVYAGAGSDERKRAAKAAIIEDLRIRYRHLRDTRWGGFPGYDAWFEGPINNAKLAAAGFYNDLAPGFMRLFELCGGDYRRFYAAVEELADLEQPRRAAALNNAKTCG